MKKLILLTLTVMVSVVLEQCRDDDNTAAMVSQKDFRKASNRIEIDSANVVIPYSQWELDPDPPVRDGQDWLQQP